MRISLEDVADLENLAEATFRAARGKRHRAEVAAFLRRLDQNLETLHREILDGSIPLGRGRRFRIRDPKPRQIYAPCFRERVLHHALMRPISPVLDRALVDDSYACRIGKGSLAAVARAQQHTRRFPWYVKMDIRAYFASIDHAILERRLRTRLKGEDVLRLIQRIVDAHEDAPGKGLPIGSLTSQIFANDYLDPLDRFLLETCGASGLVRYMDDFVFWTSTRADAIRIREEVKTILAQQLLLTAKEPIAMNRSARSVTICGFRVRPGTIRLSQRRRRGYLDARRRCEEDYRSGRIDAGQLQRAYDSAHAITAHADAGAWRRARSASWPGTEWHDHV
jgi:RNA-directed DNA polymerase